MKKRIISLILVLMMCLCMGGATLAQTNVVNGNVGIQGVVSLSSGLTKISGSTYDVWAIARVGLPEQLMVGFALFRVVNNTEVYISSANNSGYGYMIGASDTVTLTAGTYRLYAYFEGETQSNGTTKTYYIS